jgi:hypothetical protein
MVQTPTKDNDQHDFILYQYHAQEEGKHHRKSCPPTQSTQIQAGDTGAKVSNNFVGGSVIVCMPILPTAKETHITQRALAF